MPTGWRYIELQSPWVLMVVFILWICVSASIRYGCYRDQKITMSPGSSHLIEVNPVFVKQVEVADHGEKGVLLYVLSEKPALRPVKKWRISDHVVIASNGNKELSFWLNKGSSITITTKAQISAWCHLAITMSKGAYKHERLFPKLRRLHKSINGCATMIEKEDEYLIQEDDTYVLRAKNTKERSVSAAMRLNISSVIYDVSNSELNCSALNRSCQLKLILFKTRYLLLTTLHNDEQREEEIEISFVARIIIYIAILGFSIVSILLILRYLGACNSENHESNRETETRQETEPLYADKAFLPPKSTGNEENEDGKLSICSSEDPYDEKLCVICYDDQQNCFFVPCGHSATCFDCARRILDEENKICPICRGFIHKVRRLSCP